jgi:hypothetical protein
VGEIRKKMRARMQPRFNKSTFMHFPCPHTLSLV